MQILLQISRFVIPLFGITFNVLHQVEGKGGVSAVAQFTFIYRYAVPDHGRTNCRNMSLGSNNKRTYSVPCCVCAD